MSELEKITQQQWNFLTEEEKATLKEIVELMKKKPHLFVLLFSKKMMQIINLLDSIRQAAEEGKTYEDWVEGFYPKIH